MTNPNGNKPGKERFLDALVEELRTMSDTEALEGENAEDLVKLGERLLKSAREEAGRLRMADAKRKAVCYLKDSNCPCLSFCGRSQEIFGILPQSHACCARPE